jgi:hypothetical protein
VIAVEVPLIVTEPEPLALTVAPAAEPTLSVPCDTLSTVESGSAVFGFAETESAFVKVSALFSLTV